MALIKKTVVLSEGKSRGYMIVVQVGNEVGVKIVGEDLREGMKAGIKIGEKIFYLVLSGKQTESPLPVTVGQNDEIGCLVLDGEKTVLKGGRSPSPREIRRPSPSAPTAQREEGSSEERETFLEKLKSGKKDYYRTVKEKIDELFVVYPEEKNLTEKIPDSEWVKVSYDGADYYVVGRLYRDKKVAYIGYGVPGKKNILPPKITNADTTWIDTDTQNKNFNGYWLFFQDAKTGVFDTGTFDAEHRGHGDIRLRE